MHEVTCVPFYLFRETLFVPLIAELIADRTLL